MRSATKPTGSRSSRRWPLACALGFAAAALGRPCLAEPTAEERAVAADLFWQAAKAQEQGEWATCERQLAEAVELVDTPGLRFHLAYCKEQQQRWVEALVDYQRAGEMLNRGAAAPDVAELLPESIARLDEETPRLTLLLDGIPADATLYIDGAGRSLKLLNKPVPLDPGTRNVEIVAPGFEPWQQQVTLLPKERRELRVLLVSTVEPTPAPAAQAAKQTKSRDAVLTPRASVMLSEAVIAAAGLGVGIAFSVQADGHESQRDSIAREIGDPSACSRSVPDSRCATLGRADADAEDAHTFASAAYVTAAVAAVALVATWTLWPEPERKGNTVALRIAAHREGIGATLLRRF